MVIPPKGYDEVKDIYVGTANEVINSFTKDILNLENNKNIKEKELENLKEEYTNLKDSEDIEMPVLNMDTDRILKENNIDSIPLYKCIEFKDDVTEQIKNNIESSLIDLNILNAKIIKEEDLSKVRNLNTELLYLTKSNKKKNNLLKYFNIKLDNNSFLDEAYIKEILESISTNTDDSLFIEENGIAKVDVLNSIADSKYKQTFIGYLKRCELKENKNILLDTKCSAYQENNKTRIIDFIRDNI